MATKRTKAPAGPLATPLRPSKPQPDRPTILREFGDPASLEKWKAANATWAMDASFDMGSQAIDKLFLLLDRYGIDRGDEGCWFLLALRLATEHEPGFQVAKPEAPRGRPKTWTDMRRADLYRRVMVENAGREQRGLARSDTDVCRLLAKDSRWAAWGSSKVLYNQFQLGRQTVLVRMIEAIRTNPKIGDSVYSWFVERLPTGTPVLRSPK